MSFIHALIIVHLIHKVMHYALLKLILGSMLRIFSSGPVSNKYNFFLLLLLLLHLTHANLIDKVTPNFTIPILIRKNYKPNNYKSQILLKKSKQLVIK